MNRASNECGFLPGIDVPHVDWYSPVHQIDMDRCTLRTQDGVEMLFDAAASFGVDEKTIAYIRTKQENCEKGDGSFDPLQDLQDALPAAQFDAFGQYFLSSEIDLAYQGARTLHSNLRPEGEHAAPHFFNTYGTNFIWQGAFKLSHTGIPSWAVLMSHADKSAFAADIRLPDRTVPILATNENGEPAAVYHVHGPIETTDDKIPAHKNTSSHDKGNVMWYLDEPRSAKQGTEVPEHLQDRVGIIHSLGDITVKRDMELAACSPTSLPDGPLQPDAFRPFNDTSGNPGLYVARTIPFTLLRQRIEAIQ